jgi:NADPH2:quinone reductase
MRAVLVREFGPPSVLRVEELPAPVPGPGEALVRVRAVGVNPVETYVRSGQYARLPALPYVPGADGAGTVEELGPGVRGLAPGDRVYFHGTRDGRAQGAYAELAVCAAGELWPLPAALGLSQGAALGIPYATAHRALVGKAGLRPGEAVLVHGASGGVGVAAVQIARWKGARVLGTAGSPAGLALVRAEGAEAFDHGRPGYEKEVRAATGGRGADVIVEMLANVNLDRDLGLLAPGGRVVVVGNRGRVEIDPRQAMAREAAILGVMLWAATAEDLHAIHADLGPGLAGGALRPVVAEELPLAEAARAHERVMAPGARGKIVLLP